MSARAGYALPGPRTVIRGFAAPTASSQADVPLHVALVWLLAHIESDSDGFEEKTIEHMPSTGTQAQPVVLETLDWQYDLRE